MAWAAGGVWALTTAVAAVSLLNEGAAVERRGKPFARLVTSSGAVLFRGEDLIIWQDLEPGQDLTLGDVVATGEESRAELALTDGHTIVLSEGTQIALTSEKTDSSLDAIVTLLKGLVEAKAAPAAPTAAAAEAPVRPLQIRAGNAKFELKRSGEELGLRAPVGTKEATVWRAKGEVARIEAGKAIKLAPVDAPQPRETAIRKPPAATAAAAPMSAINLRKALTTSMPARRISEATIREALAKPIIVAAPSPAKALAPVSFASVRRVPTPVPAPAPAPVTAPPELAMTSPVAPPAAVEVVPEPPAPAPAVAPTPSEPLPRLFATRYWTRRPLREALARDRVSLRVLVPEGVRAGATWRPLIAALGDVSRVVFGREGDRDQLIDVPLALFRAADRGPSGETVLTAALGTHAGRDRGEARLIVRSLADLGTGPGTLRTGTLRIPATEADVFAARDIRSAEEAATAIHLTDARDAPLVARVLATNAAFSWEPGASQAPEAPWSYVRSGTLVAEVTSPEADAGAVRGLGGLLGADLVFAGSGSAYLGHPDRPDELRARLAALPAGATVFALTGDKLLPVTTKLLKSSEAARKLVFKKSRALFAERVELLSSP